MARSAPELASAFGQALALRQLLELADGFDFVAASIQDVNGGGLLEVLAWMEISPMFFGVQNAYDAFQMTLLANAVASTGGQLLRIDDVAC